MNRTRRKAAARASLHAAFCLAFALEADAQTAPPDASAHNEQRLRLQLDEARARVAERPDLLTRTQAGPASPTVFPVETPCFLISSIEWRGAASFPWLPGRVAIEGHCLGAQGLRVARTAIARALLDRGYMTTQVVVPEQDLSTGRLLIEIVAGRIGQIRDAEGRIGRPATVLPPTTGDLLNVRDLDQALENIRRLPGQRTTAFDLLPGAEAGQSDIVFRHPADAARVHGVLTADNAGVDASGRNQLGPVVSIDSPLHLHDQLIATFSGDPHFRRRTRGSTARSIAWNVPIGYASFSVGASEWAARQRIEDPEGTYPYASRTRRFEMGMAYVPYRSGHSKGTLRLSLFRRQENSWFDGKALDVQRRDTTGFDLAFSHLEKFDDALFEFGVGLRGSLPGESRFPGHVQDHPDWNGRYRVATARASSDLPFEAGGQRFGYRGSLLLQHAPTPLPSSEYLQLGGRDSVRGLDGNTTLFAPGGWLWRNELAIPIPVAASTSGFGEAYAALDTGAVSGGATPRHARRLAGVALGLRGSQGRMGYDFSVGTPVTKPEALKSRKPFLNFLLTTSF